MLSMLLYRDGQVFESMFGSGNVKRLIFSCTKYLWKITWDDSAKYDVSIGDCKRTTYNRTV